MNNSTQKYIGQTKRQFGTRLKKHQRAAFFSKKENSCVTHHKIAWENSKIITTNVHIGGNIPVLHMLVLLPVCLHVLALYLGLSHII